MGLNRLSKSEAIALSAIAFALLPAIAQSQDVHTAYLASGESVTYVGYFLANEDIYASCDTNCEDLDIYLYDAQTEELIESDTLIDANPIVTAPYDGDFLVETVMITCRAAACETWTDSDEGF
ncbi:MAG: hypothetical protein AAGF98_04490 [Cyanobacteria bacterium P01_H01_bin.153]